VVDALDTYADRLNADASLVADMFRSHTWHEIQLFDGLKATLGQEVLQHLTCADTGESTTGNVGDAPATGLA
jgi:hypothetical protein